MLRNRHICALDIGSTKVCAMLSDLREERIIGVVNFAARGVSRGAVVDANDLTEIIADVIAKLEEKAGLRIKDVYANISGAHIESKNVKGKIIISEQGNEIGADDIDKVINFAGNTGLPLERKIIHTIVQDYAVDGQEGIANAINLHGRELEVNLRIITALRQEIGKLTNSIICAGLNIRELVFSAIASGYSVLREDEKQSGVILFDIGGGVMDLAIFKGGAVKFAAVIPVVALELDEILSLVRDVYSNTLIPMRTQADTGTQAGTGTHRLENKDSGHFSAVITGGYPSAGELREKIEKTLSIPVRVGLPHKQHPDISPLQAPAYATGIGLIQYGISREKQQKKTLRTLRSEFSKLVFQAKKTFSGYF